MVASANLYSDLRVILALLQRLQSNGNVLGQMPAWLCWLLAVGWQALLARSVGGSALVLEPPHLQGIQLECYNSWNELGWKDWSNVTLRVAASKDLDELGPVRPDAIQHDTGTVSNNLRIMAKRSEQGGGHIVYFNKLAAFPVGHLNRRLLPSALGLLSDPNQFMYINCGSRNLKDVRSVANYILQSPDYAFPMESHSI